MEIIILLTLYILSIFVSLGFNCATQLQLSKNINNLTYNDIGKYDVLSLKRKVKSLMCFLIVILIPGLNLYNSFQKYQEVLKKPNSKIYIGKFGFGFDKITLGPSLLISMYRYQNEMEDNLKLDGLTEHELRKQLVSCMKEKDYKYISEDAYEDIKASKQAIDFVKDLEINDGLKLTRNQRIKLLKEYRKAFLKDSEETMKPIQKTLKINNKNNIRNLK